MSNKSLFIKEGDDNAVEAFRRLHNNTNLMVSTCLYNAPEPSTQKIFDLRFHLSSEDSEKTRTSTLEACYYINENFSIPQDCIEVIYTGGGNGMNAGAAGSAANNGGESGNNDADTNSTAAETVILIPPIVFAGQPTPLMPAINYELARQMIEDGIENLDIDIYQKDFCIPLPNSLSNGTYVISITFKELLNLNSYAIEELSKRPRPEDSMIIPRVVPEAVEWFNEVCKEEEKRQYRQSQLQKLILEKGWQITPCSRRLLWADLSKEQALEACRIISQFYSWIKASPDEIWHHLQQIDRRNRIEDYPRLKAIVNFATENPRFAGCEHPLMQRLCPAGKCFMAELFEKYEKPYLFEQV